MKRIALILLVACGPMPSQNTSQLCPASGEPSGRTAATVLGTAKDIANLAIANSALVYLDKETNSVRRMGLDGSGDALLYTPANSTITLYDVAAKGDVVFVTEQERTLTAATNRLLRVPLAGGTPTATALPAPYMYILGVGDDTVDLKVGNDGSEMSLIGRVALGSGTFTQLLGPGIIESVNIMGSDIYFLTRDAIGDDASSRRFTRAPNNTIPNTFCRGMIYTTSTSLFCAGYSTTGDNSPSSAVITKTALDGSGAATWISLRDQFQGSSAFVSPGNGDELVVSVARQGDPTWLLAVNAGTGAARPLSCTTFGPDTRQGISRPMLVTTADAVYWVADGDKTTDPSTIYKTSFR